MSSKPTRGPVTVCHTLVSNEVRGFSITAAPHGSCDPICASDFRSERSSSEIEANALLIKEAFDIAAETGLTPQQLREQREALVTQLKSIANAAYNIGSGQRPEGWEAKLRGLSAQSDALIVRLRKDSVEGRS